MPLSKATTSLDRTFLALTSALFVTRPSTALSTKLDISALTLEKSPMSVHSLDAQSVSPAQTNSLVTQEYITTPTHGEAKANIPRRPTRLLSPQFRLASWSLDPALPT
jgi:hypothetical protein